MDDDFKKRTVDIEYQDKEGDGVYCESEDIIFYCDDSPKYRCLQCNHKFTDIHG